MKRLHAFFVEAFSSLEGIASEEARYMNRLALISNIGATTRIENAVLTDSEIEWVDTTLCNDGRITAFEENKSFILDKLSKDRERSVEEVVGSRQVLTTIYLQSRELFPLSETIVRGLHHNLLRYYPAAAEHAGGYKGVPNTVVSHSHETGEKRVVLDPAPPGIVTETAMAELVRWYNSSIREHPWPILVATEFVFRFLAIHPFEDGNGRIGRALFVLSFLHSDDRYLSSVVPYLALDRHIEQNSSLYYSVLQQCAGGRFDADPHNYAIEPLAWFFARVLEHSLADIAFYRKRYQALQGLSASALAVLGSFKSHPEKRLKVAGIVEETAIPRRTVQHALRTLTSQGFLQLLGRGAATRYQLIF